MELTFLVIRNFPGAGGRRFENMTIEIKRISFLPWIPGNIREMSQGDTLNQKSKTSEGLYVWGIMVLTQDSALTVHARPYTVNMDGVIVPGREETSSGVAVKDQINSFGPNNRRWRWRP